MTHKKSACPPNSLNKMYMLCSIIGHKFELSDRLKNLPWLSTLAYLADIFGKLNELCLGLQGKQVNIYSNKR